MTAQTMVVEDVLAVALAAHSIGGDQARITEHVREGRVPEPRARSMFAAGVGKCMQREAD